MSPGGYNDSQAYPKMDIISVSDMSWIFRLKRGAPKNQWQNTTNIHTMEDITVNIFLGKSVKKKQQQHLGVQEFFLSKF